ncbi:hypothetical protein F3Y22_tig00002237pilonHSYRG00394 [Hibiscus syriacus]|uniref:Uncharacterized protein n=1 Tax=Hibiscus syriacus TaxID=106335 RepID=A0A6A3CYG1_HIBSY|nr:hypothetical protein F3Y22_tig00002237pilonHSYRG00394 [Hibiscus syriacus]
MKVEESHVPETESEENSHHNAGRNEKVEMDKPSYQNNLMAKNIINGFRDSDEFGRINVNDGLIVIGVKDSWLALVTSDKFRESRHVRWFTCLILKHFGRSIGFRALDERLRKLWARKADYELIDVGECYFLSKVHFPGLPMHYYNERMLFTMGNSIGRAFKVDQKTSYTSKGRFARVCVEVNFAKALVPKFEFDGR